MFSFQHLLSNSSDPQLINQGLRAPSAGCWLSLPHLVSNWLNFLCTELYNSSTSTFFLWASQIALIQPIHGQGYTLLFLDRMHLLFTQVHFLFWQPSGIVGQYATLWNEKNLDEFFYSTFPKSPGYLSSAPQGFFSVEIRRKTVATHSRQIQKCLGPRSYSSKKRLLWHQAISLASLESVKGSRDGPPEVQVVTTGTKTHPIGCVFQEDTAGQSEPRPKRPGRVCL